MGEPLVGRCPLVLGHKGAPLRAPENTLPAFRAARELGADGVELDVHVLADGVLAVHHDDGAPGIGPLALADWTTVHARTPSIPTLGAVLDECAGLLVNIEIKAGAPGDPEAAERSDRSAAAVAGLLDARGPGDRVIVSSFSLVVIDRMRALDPSVPTGYLTVMDPPPDRAVDIAAERGHTAVHPFVGTVLGEQGVALVARARDLSIGLNVWTVNDLVAARELATLGVDGIITDRPGEVKAAIVA